LINDEFGNFIIQHVISLKSKDFNQQIFNYIKQDLAALSKQKYSSNVIDKTILYEDSIMLSSIIDKMIEKKLISELILDQYGNYGKNCFDKLVIQKVLQVATGSKFLEIIEMIKKVLKTMKQTNYGKKIYDNLMANYGEYFNTSNNKPNINTSSSKAVKKAKNNTSL
jgi:hypothetical protein